MDLNIELSRLHGGVRVEARVERSFEPEAFCDVVRLGRGPAAVLVRSQMHGDGP